jgi:glutamine amidotransferase
MITIVDYDAGNIRSIVNMLSQLGIKSRISGEPAEIETAERLILPGVGHFDYGMRNLAQRGLVEALNARVLGEGVPMLGICLGAQLLTRGSEEGELPGLGWIAARTVRFDRARMDARLRVPHMGWADTWASRESPLAKSIPADARFYYVHSYHIVCDEPEQAILAARHGYEFTAGVGRGNVLGVQFHPEKSHRFGAELLRAFSAWRPAEAAGGRSQAA